MLHLSRLCSKPSIFIQQTKQLLAISCRNYARNAITTSRTPTVWTRQSFTVSKINHFLRGTGTIAAQLSTDASTKGKKAVGYWLLTCSGMVFVAVVLGTITAYYVLLVSICLVLEEVIKKSVK